MMDHVLTIGVYDEYFVPQRYYALLGLDMPNPEPLKQGGSTTKAQSSANKLCMRVTLKMTWADRDQLMKDARAAGQSPSAYLLDCWKRATRG